MPISLHNNFDLGVVSLLAILTIYAEAESRAKPYLVKDGIKIIL